VMRLDLLAGFRALLLLLLLLPLLPLLLLLRLSEKCFKYL
jgi:hypothetical protein